MFYMGFYEFNFNCNFKTVISIDGLDLTLLT